MLIQLVAIVLVGECAGKFSEWNSWSPCTVTCGSGVMSRQRVSKFETCYSELSERKVCLNDPCIEHGNLTNVALGASATASSVFLAAFPTGNVVDGDEATDFYTGTCTQTNKDDEPWLRIELNGTALIEEVVVFNRGDCCSERLNQMEITVGEDPYGYNNTLCGKRGMMDGVKMARVSCYESIKGSYIFVRIPGPQYLALCEVKVYGRFIHRGASTTPLPTPPTSTPRPASTTPLPTPPTSTPRPEKFANVAVGKVAHQSSTSLYDNCTAENAIDGNLITYSCTYYDIHIMWWRVDLGTHAIIYKARIYTPYFHFVRNATVTIGDEVNGFNMTSCGIVTAEGGKQRREGDYAYDVICDEPVVGRYIQVNKTSGNGYNLEMAEFEAYGLELANVAVGKVAHQSSTFQYQGADMAIDGDLTTCAWTNSYIAWWRVDLGKSATIFKVRLYQYHGTGFGYMANTMVTIGNNVDVANMTSCGMILHYAKIRHGHSAYDVTCETPLVGRFVQVNKNSNNRCRLFICELEAYGRYIEML